MRVKIKLFSVFREAVGKKEIELSMEKNCRVRDVIHMLGEEYPAIKKFIEFAIVSINHEYADENSLVKNGDEIAIFPPIGGG